MKRFALIFSILSVCILAVWQLGLPVHADTCSVIDHQNCEADCNSYKPANCVLVGVTCQGGPQVSCGCDLFCTIITHDPDSGGHKHMEIIEASY